MERTIPARLTAPEGRRFAFPVGIAFLVLAGITWWRDHPLLYQLFGGVGVALLLAGVLVPTRLGPVYRGWMRLAHLISRITNPIIMGIMYLLAITPMGLLRRTLGSNPMKHAPADGSYWKVRSAEAGRQSDLTRQF